MKKEKITAPRSSYWRTIAWLFIKAGAFGAINLFINLPADEDVSGPTVDNEDAGDLDNFFLQGSRLKGFSTEPDYYLFARS